MATRSGKEATGKRVGGTPARKGDQPVVGRAGTAHPGATGRNTQAGSRAGAGRGTDPEPSAEDPQFEREDSEARKPARSVGPRRILIFARSLQEASDIAKRKKYPRELWRFVTGPADTDVDPRQWATITVVGFGKGRPLAKDAYDQFQARCRGYGIRAPSYDP